MTNATKTLALIFAGTLALAAATSWSWSPGSSAAFRQELIAVDTSAVQAVRIERSDQSSLRLEQTDDGWSVAPTDTSVTYPADDRSINRLLSTLPSLQVSAVATREPDKHPQYGVDSTGTTITMLGSDDEPLGELIVGRMQIRRSQSGQQRRRPMQRRGRGTPITYVRSPDRPDVYSVEQSFRSLTSRDLEDWRDKQIWALSRAQIQRIDFQYPADSSFTIRRSAPSDSATARSKWVSAGDTLARSKVSSMLRMISSPQADGFAEKMSPDDFGEAPFVLRLHLEDGSVRALRLKPQPGGQRYLATASGYPYVAELRTRRWDRSVLLGRSSYLSGE